MILREGRNEAQATVADVLANLLYQCFAGRFQLAFQVRGHSVATQAGPLVLL